MIPKSLIFLLHLPFSIAWRCIIIICPSDLWSSNKLRSPFSFCIGRIISPQLTIGTNGVLQCSNLALLPLQTGLFLLICFPNILTVLSYLHSENYSSKHYVYKFSNAMALIHLGLSAIDFCNWLCPVLPLIPWGQVHIVGLQETHPHYADYASLT